MAMQHYTLRRQRGSKIHYKFLCKVYGLFFFFVVVVFCVFFVTERFGGYSDEPGVRPYVRP